MSEGRKAGIALAVGIAAGSLSWSLLSVLGLSAVLATYAAFGAFFLYAGGRLLTDRS